MGSLFTLFMTSEVELKYLQSEAVRGTGRGSARQCEAVRGSARQCKSVRGRAKAGQGQTGQGQTRARQCEAVLKLNTFANFERSSKIDLSDFFFGGLKGYVDISAIFCYCMITDSRK
jgi:hypothetical protein